MSGHPGLLFSFSRPIATRVDELLYGVKAQLAIKLYGSDLDGLVRHGKEIEVQVKEVPDTRDAALEPVVVESQLVVRPERDQLARFGIPVAMVNAINQNLAGGLELPPAILEGALSRLRPVLMTAVTTVLGLAPLLYAIGVGSAVQRPSAASRPRPSSPCS